MVLCCLNWSICISLLNFLLVSRLMWPKQITLCGQWGQTSVINMLIHGSGRWISLFTTSIRYWSSQLCLKCFLEFLFSCFVSLMTLPGLAPLVKTLRMDVSMHYIQHHLSTLMQNMQLMSIGLLKLMISSREFILDTPVINLCLELEVRREKGRGGKWQTSVWKFFNEGKEREVTYFKLNKGFNCHFSYFYFISQTRGREWPFFPQTSKQEC